MNKFEVLKRCSCGREISTNSVLVGASRLDNGQIYIVVDCVCKSSSHYGIHGEKTNEEMTLLIKNWDKKIEVPRIAI